MSQTNLFDSYNLRNIALYQRKINLGILLPFLAIGLCVLLGCAICFIGGMLHLPEESMEEIINLISIVMVSAFVIAYFGYLIWMLSAIYSLANSLQFSGCLILVLWIPLAFTFPFINLLILLWMSRKANKILTAAGYKVGFLGADMRQFQPTEMYQPEPIEPPQ
ncbi:hypothetical protein FACS189427_04990 [Planctomycetales bacterium]|nr:hypothetical protein FACS189427_04990 [Planctomycetales bacterium]